MLALYHWIICWLSLMLNTHSSTYVKYLWFAKSRCQNLNTRRMRPTDSLRQTIDTTRKTKDCANKNLLTYKKQRCKSGAHVLHFQRLVLCSFAALARFLEQSVRGKLPRVSRSTKGFVPPKKYYGEARTNKHPAISRGK